MKYRIVICTSFLIKRIQINNDMRTHSSSMERIFKQDIYSCPEDFLSASKLQSCVFSYFVHITKMSPLFHLMKLKNKSTFLNKTHYKTAWWDLYPYFPYDMAMTKSTQRTFFCHLKGFEQIIDGFLEVCVYISLVRLSHGSVEAA